MQAYILFIAPALFLITSEFFFTLNEYKKNYKLKWLFNFILLLFIALPIRYMIERVKPFENGNRNPGWVVDLRRLNDRNISNGILFNYFSQMFVKMIGNVQRFILFIAVFVTVSLTLVAANGMAMSMRERTTEIAVLKAIGFQNSKVLALLLGEAVLIAAIGGLLGVAAGRGIYALRHEFAPQFIQRSSMPWSVMAWGMAVAGGIGLASGIVPAVLAARLSVVDGLRRIV